MGSHIRTTIVSPGAIETELLNHITDQGLKQGMEDVYKDALNPNEVAKALVNAIDTDASTSINEVVIRPTRQLP